MVEVSEIGLKEDEIELDLGLSIGGSFRNSGKWKPVERESPSPFDSRTNGFDADLRENQTTFSRSSTSTTSLEAETTPLDPQTKREIHAFRRQEAKKKQQEKRCRGRNSAAVQQQDHGNVEIQTEEERPRKREKTESSVGSKNNAAKSVVNLSSSNGQTERYPVPEVQYHFPPMQFVPYENGLAYPYVMQCWAPSGGNEKNVFQPVPCKGFRPFVAHQNLGLSLPQNGGSDSDQNGRREEGKCKKSTSNGSPVCSSSTISDHRSSSYEGNGSSDTRTQSSHSLPGQYQVNGSQANDIKGHSEQSASSHPNPNDSAKLHEDGTRSNEKVIPSHVTQSSPAAVLHKEESLPGRNPVPIEKPIVTAENSNRCSLKEAKMENGKSPKHQLQSNDSLCLPQMPYVSATGNGPNGKTINGFLYRYTKSEVSIVCVCHGSTFSPAEFVQHAGGTDVSHPLRHITVIPSAFG
ncbi:uncharacterized protein LOC107426548 [Ziziphus jujuba]|uniref:Ninja-family protein n=1 Tax=Ziziphus jujuba TaxID=326968 RepID=A0A6P4B1L8_ZIZJJ|nr:uncharacterized protein LOC107426548 [Ziziphus jujuba]